MTQPARVLIRRVDEKTFDDFLGLIDKLAEYENLPPPDTEAKARLKQHCLSDPSKFSAFLAQLEGKYVGYAIYYFTYSSFLALPTLFIEDLFVLEKYRKHGIGEKMFTFLKQTAKRGGCGRIEFIVLDWNKSAHEFYEKNLAKRQPWYLYRLTKEGFS
jgi:GNAT superfamily N-acetyltransferase